MTEREQALTEAAAVLDTLRNETWAAHLKSAHNGALEAGKLAILALIELPADELSKTEASVPATEGEVSALDVHMDAMEDDWAQSLSFARDADKLIPIRAGLIGFIQNMRVELLIRERQLRASIARECEMARERDEAIKTYRQYHDGLADDLPRAEASEAKVCSLTQQLAEIGGKDEWVSVEPSSPPPLGKDVVVRGSNEDGEAEWFAIASLDIGGRDWVGSDGVYLGSAFDGDVTHWRPRPAFSSPAPKEGE